MVWWSGVGTYICKVICCSFRGGGIGAHVHMRCYFQMCLIQSSITGHHSDLVLYFLFKQVPIFVTDLLYTFPVFLSLLELLDVNGGFIGECVRGSHPLVVGGGLWGAFRFVRYELHARHP